MMNELSWMIYLAGALGGLKTGIAIAMFGMGLALIVASIIFIVNKVCSPTVWSWQDKKDVVERHNALGPEMLKWMKFSGKAFTTLLIVQVFIPNQSTVYAIAASQMGEKVIKSSTGDKAMRALDAWLDRQIKGDGKARD